MVPSTARKGITYTDYVKIDDSNRYEVFHGDLRMVPAPSTDHQDVSRNLEFLIWNFVKEKRLGKVFNAPIDVVFDDEEVYQPDIVFIQSKRRDIIRKNAIHGVPDLIVEIVSPSSAFYDTVEKKEIYRKYGVNEYWLVFPDEKAIEVFILEKGEYLEFCNSKKETILKSRILKGLEISPEDVFE